jgi:hypothetical protein
MSTATKKTGGRLRLKISLEDWEPAIWRRVEVDKDLTFEELHRVIQGAMGWDDDHLHEFRAAGRVVSMPNLEDDMFGGQPALPEDTTTLGELLARQRKFRYWYDFGDDWWHTIAIETRLPSDPAAPRAVLVAGESACPPENCGGVYRYANLLEVLKDPDHEDYEEMREWLGDDFDPNMFDFAAHARRVAAIG